MSVAKRLLEEQMAEIEREEAEREAYLDELWREEERREEEAVERAIDDDEDGIDDDDDPERDSAPPRHRLVMTPELRREIREWNERHPPGEVDWQQIIDDYRRLLGP